MKPIDRVISLLPTNTLRELADRLEVSYEAVRKWRNGQIPPERCREIEELVGGRVTREELRPDVFGPVDAKRSPMPEDLRRTLRPEPMDRYKPGSLERALDVVKREGPEKLSDYEQASLAMSLLGICVQDENAGVPVAAAEEIAGAIGFVAEALGDDGYFAKVLKKYEDRAEQARDKGSDDSEEGDAGSAE
jgi:DNA-binding transcriptional regulator YdaS (Cro superfamily)